MQTDTALLIRDTLLDAIEATQDTWKPGGQRMSATGHCRRKQYYQITGAPRGRMSAVSLEEMEDGNTHEDAIVTRLRAAGYTITGDGEDQPEITLELPGGGVVTGHTDGTIIGPALYELHLLEIKAMGARRYASFTKEGVAAAFPDYMMQVQMYMAATGLPGCVFIAKAKDSSAVKMFNRRLDAHPKYHVEIIEADPVLAAEAIARHVDLRLHLLAGKPPAREYKQSDWQCKYCEFSRRCWV
jgi:hypothetical protein